MTTIGVYDSGIGGLTTAVKLREVLGGYDFFFYADNASMPFGAKTCLEIYNTVTDSMKILRDNSDIQVIACNTASTVVAPSGAFLLVPQTTGLDPEKTLILATPPTLKALGANEKFFNTADTASLATLVEIQASLRYKSRSNLDMKALIEYLDLRLKDFSDISNVVLGCSHYIYVKNLVSYLFPEAVIDDGNDALATEIASMIPNKNGRGKMTFKFSGANECSKYKWIVEKLENR